MKRLYAWFDSQPLRSIRLRLFLYLFLVGTVPTAFALFFFYAQSSAQSEKEWQQTVTNTHDRLLRRLEREWRGLEYVYLSARQDPAVESFLRLNAPGVRPDDKQIETAKDSIRRMVEVYMDHFNYLTDICFALEGRSTFCANGSPQEYDWKSVRAPVNRNDAYLQEMGNGRIRWIGPLYDPRSFVVEGYAALVMDMSRLLDDLRNEFSISAHVIWDKAGGVGLFESPGPERETGGRGWAVPFLSEREPLLRSVAGVYVSQQPVPLPGKTWMSYIEIPNTAQRSIRSSLSNTLAVFFSILLVVSALGTLLFARLFTRPLDALRSLMKRAELGDMKAYWTSGGIREIDELGFSYNQMLNRLEETIKQAKLEEALKKEAEIEALQYQLNPHFLYNTLNTIKWVAKIHKTPQISEVVSALVRLLQASLGKKGDFLPLKEEIGLIQDYMEIQSFRYGDQVKLHLDIDPLASVCLVPKLMLQPLVENALIHGLEHQAKEGAITIKAWLDRDMLLCEVQDNGKGMADPEAVMEPLSLRRSAKERMSGIGLRHIREKIKLYYGPDYKMHIFSKPNEGTTVRLSLPIHRSEE